MTGPMSPADLAISLAVLIFAYLFILEIIRRVLDLESRQEASDFFIPLLSLVPLIITLFVWELIEKARD